MFSGVMSEKPDIHFTIVIPTLNCSQWVENCLSSVCNQSHSSYDVIYIDDASTDGTAEADPGRQTTPQMTQDGPPTIKWLDELVKPMEEFNQPKKGRAFRLAKNSHKDTCEKRY